MKRLCIALALVMVGSFSSAFAQTQPAPRPARQPPAPSRAFVSVNGAYQATSNDFRDSSSFRVNAEDGQLGVAYDVQAGPAFDIAVGATVWRQLGIGVGVSRFSRTTESTIAASVPHPFFFNRARSVSGTAGGLSRNETAVHVQARGTFPVHQRLVVMVFGGPSFFRVSQDMVTDFTYAETYPYDTATFSGPVTTNAKKGKVGFNAGADVAYFFGRQIGAGVTVKVAGTTVDLPSIGGGTAEVKAGGTQVGGGLRLRF